MLKLLPKNEKPDYDTFYSQNYSKVLYYVKNKINSAEDAEDLTSEVFAYCWQHYDDYDPEKSAVTTWLYLIVNSRVKNYYRDHVTFADYDTVAQVMEDEHIDLDQGVYLEQLHGVLMRAIRTLPERQQKIVMMRYFQNLSGDEIARELGISPGNVRVLLSRALDKLSNMNDNYWKEFRNNG